MRPARHPKKNIFCIISLAAAAALAIGISLGPSKADASKISSKGNFIFENGEKVAAFYAEDIDYLQKEITTLFHEMEEDENE